MNKFFKKLLLLLALVMASISSYAQVTFDDLKILKNNKEPTISAFSQKDQEAIKGSFPDPDYRRTVRNKLYLSIMEFLNNDYSKCEMSIVNRFVDKINITGLTVNQTYIEKLLKMLRIDNAIDDIAYKMLSAINQDYFALSEIEQKYTDTNLNLNSNRPSELSELYESFKKWPNETTECAYGRFIDLLENVPLSKKPKKKKVFKTRLKTLASYNKQALKASIISPASYHKLEYLRRHSNVIRGELWFADYFQTMQTVKDSNANDQPDNSIYQFEKENNFSSEHLKRLNKISVRELLYIKYNAQQISQLAEVLIKASRRMGSDPNVEAYLPTITQEFTIINDQGEKENYVETLKLTPLEQYNYARKRMRKDILDLQVTEEFRSTDIYYRDIVMAALETGYITFEEISVVVQYDDLWNPTKTKFEKVMNFIFGVANVGTFFVPPPFNIVSSIALTVVEGVIDQKHKNGADNDNPATIID